MQYKIVAIEREYGSGGRDVAKRTAERLGIKVYGKEILLCYQQNDVWRRNNHV